MNSMVRKNHISPAKRTKNHFFQSFLKIFKKGETHLEEKNWTLLKIDIYE